MKDLVKSLGTQWYLKDRLPCNWSRISLQERDRKILRTLLEQKYLSWEQILNHFFEGHKRYAYIRLWKLRRFELMQKLVAGFFGFDLYLPTPLTNQCFEEFTGLSPFTLPDPQGLSHDLLVTDIRFLFERMGFGSSWASERVWRMRHSEKRLRWVPDAVVYVDGRILSLEVEQNQEKDESDYDEGDYNLIFSESTDKYLFSGCLYVTTEALLNKLMEHAKKHYPEVFFTTITELFQKKEKTIFRNGEGHSFTIEKHLEKPLKPSSS